MLCPKCAAENPLDETRCANCSDSLSVAVLEVVRGELPEKIRFLKPRSYAIGRARHNDIALNEPSISKLPRPHRLPGRPLLHRGRRAACTASTSTPPRSGAPSSEPGLAGPARQRDAQVLARSAVESATGAMAKLPWIEQQQLLLSLVQTLNSTLVLSQVLEQVLDAIMHITGRRARLPAARRHLPGGGALPDRRRAQAARGARTRRTASRETATASPRRSCRRALETGEVVSTVRSRGEVGGAGARAARRRTRTQVQDDRLPPAALPALGRGGRRRLPARPRRALRRQRPPRRSRSATTACAPPRLWRATPRSPSRTRSCSSASSSTIEELRKAQKQLLQSEKLATIGQMAAGIAHELNTPLTYIMGNLELLELQELTAAPARDAGLDRPGAPSGIRTLAQRLLAFSRPGRGGAGPARAQRRRRAQPGAVPVPDRERAAFGSSKSLAPGPAARARRLEPARDGADQPRRERRPRHGREGWRARGGLAHGTATRSRSRCADRGPGIPEKVRSQHVRALRAPPSPRARGPGSACPPC